jgi:alpha-L-fucosidase
MANWDDLKRDAPEWFRDAKFGMFFHWGPYSAAACENEWYSRNIYTKGLSQHLHHVKTYGPLRDFGYKNLYDKLTGEKFNADEWADIVRRAGVKYAGPVTEHADNFSLWDSRVNPVNSVSYGPKKDITGLCAEAFRRQGIKTLATFHHQWLWGWFMSTDSEADVYDPANEKYYWEALPLETNRAYPYRKPDARFNTMWYQKIEEVVKKYHPDVVYFDSRVSIIDEDYRYRCAKIIRDELGENPITYKGQDFPEGVGVKDIERGHFSDIKPFVWQTDDRLEDNITWCIVENPKYRNAGKVIRQLCDVVSKNGNLLLNCGPQCDGSFHPDAVKELEAVGNWLKVNGEAIYGSRPFEIAGEGPASMDDADYDTGKLKKQLQEGKEAKIKGLDDLEFTSKDFRFTRKGSDVYAIAFGWPEDGKLSIKAFKEGGYLPRISSVSLLGEEKPLNFRRTPEALEVTLTPQKPYGQPAGHAFTLKIK